MAPEAEIYDYRVLCPTGSMSVNQAVREAVRQAMKDGCHIINISLGGPHPDAQLRAVLIEAQKAGIIVVAACGNKGDGDETINDFA